MTVFSNSILSFLLLVASPAYAATSAPHELAPALNAPAPSGEDAQDQDNVGYTEAPAVPIKVEPIGKPSDEGFGTLNASNGGMPADIWKNGNRETDEFLLGQLGTGVSNDTMRQLLITLLLSESAPPSGQKNENWLVSRVRALTDIGEDGKAAELMASVPASMSNQQLLQIAASMGFARGEYEKFCKQAAESAHQADEGASVFWKKLSVACLAQEGKRDEAMVGIDVLHETSADDPFFQDMIHHINDKNFPVKSLPKKISLFDFGLIRIAGETERLKDKMDALPPLAVKYLATDPAADVKLREKATAKAQQMGMLPAGEGNRQGETPFSKTLASDVATLTKALGSGKPATDADNAVIARLALDDAGVQDSRRIEKLLTLMELFDYKVPRSTWLKLLSHKNRYDGETPPALFFEMLEEAVKAGRKSEVILLASIIIDSNDTQKMADIMLVPVIRALKSAGYEKEARAISYSAVKAYQ